MVIVFNKDTKQIHHTEDGTMSPKLPVGSFDEKKAILAGEGLDFVSIPYEMGGYIVHFDLCFNDDGLFTGLQPKTI